MKIKVVLEGKLKESFYREGSFEYAKRLQNQLEIIETSNISEYLKNKKQSFIVTLEIEGKQLDSIQFANKIREIELDGHYNEIIFLIGGGRRVITNS